ncbi:MAG: S8 family serine peptidase, partial [Thermoplasmatota archaeon]
MFMGIRRISVFLMIFMLLSFVPQMVDSSGETAAPIQDSPVIWTHYGKMTLGQIEESINHGPFDHDSDFRILQFDGPIYPHQTDEIRKRGGVIVDYIPDFAYIVDAGGSDIDDLLIIDGVVGETPYPSGMKIHPSVLESILSGERHDDLVVESFRPDPDIASGLERFSDEVEPVSTTRYVIHDWSGDIMDLISVEGIKWIEPRSEFVFHNNVAEGIIGVTEVFDTYGLDGSGQIVGIADSGLDTGVDDHNTTGDIHLDFDNRVTLSNWFGASADDGMGHGTHVTGSVAGNGNRSSGNIKGMAPNSSIFFQGIMDDAFNLRTPGNLSVLFSEAYDNGVRIHTNSWGSSGNFGQYSFSSYDVDWSMYHNQDLLILFSAGNDGNDPDRDGKINPTSVTPPATAKSVLAVGASENQRPTTGLMASWNWFVTSANPISSDHISNNSGGLAAFSSRGPTVDGRYKPEVVAPGTNILSTKSSVETQSIQWRGYDSYYVYMGGTSMSCPVTAGMAVLVRQYFNDTMGEADPSGSLIKAAIINGAVDMTPGQYGAANPTTQEINGRPDNDQGWGRINLTNSIYPRGGTLAYLDEKDGLRTGENVTRVFRVDSSDEIRLTLSWADFPGPIFGSKELINNLDLIITAPNGTRYFGNDFLAPFDDARDDVNPTETITISDPAVGWWRVEVEGYNVPMGRQPFALVLSGNTTNIIQDAIGFDRNFYSTDGDTVKIQLTGMALAGTGFVEVFLNSTSQPAGLIVNLTENGDEGTFVGSVTTSNRSTSEPGMIYVEDNDTLYVSYFSAHMCGICEDSASVVKPIRVFLKWSPEYFLTYSKYDLIRLDGYGDPGHDVWWTIEGSPLGWLVLHDDGFGGDFNASDGLYHSDYHIVDDMKTGGSILLKIADPYLGDMIYREFNISIDTGQPRTPKNLRAYPLEEGNSALLKWDRSDEPGLSHYMVYVNTTPPVIDLPMENWQFHMNTGEKNNHTTVRGLADGIRYFFRVSAVFDSGNESSASLWNSTIPEDLLAPRITLLNEKTTLSGTASLIFETDPDTEMIEVQYYPDLNRNDLPDDGMEFMNASNSTTNVVAWDTRIGAGGPGDMDSIIFRFRAWDEGPNVSPWYNKSGFSVDNTGPSGITLDRVLPRITRIKSQRISGTTEIMATVDILINGELRETIDTGSVGKFSQIVDLDEGFNDIMIRAYDQWGAGPTEITTRVTLDTMRPMVHINHTGGNVSISRNGTRFSSVIEDLGMDPEFRGIGNITWEVIDPENRTGRFYENQSLRLRFEHLGEYVIKLRAVDLAGNSNITQIGINVVDRETPVVVINGPSTINEGTAVVYDPEGTIDNDLLILERYETSFNWFVSGPMNWTHSTKTKTMSVVFPHPGEFIIRLAITDAGGNIGYRSFTVNVNDITPPMVEILGQTFLFVGDQRTYTANVTDNDPEFPKGILFYWTLFRIDEINGSVFLISTNDTSFSYDFDSPDEFILRLKITDASGNNNTVEKRIYVREISVSGDGNDGIGLLIVVGLISLLAILILAAIGIYSYVKKEKITDVEWEGDEDEDFEEDEAPLQAEQEKKIIARICKRAAVKAGKSLSISEQEALLSDLEKC